MVKNSSRVLRPPFITAANSFGRNNRRDLGSPPGALTDGQTLSRERPFARRALRMARPLAVFMRARNPWVRLRFSTLG